MKIKVIAFPLMLAFCITLFIWFIKPDYDKFTDFKNTLAAKESELAGIQAKRQKIKSLAADLASHEDQRQLVLRYLPEVRKEEEIISGVDNLAKSALVSLLNMGVEAKISSAQPSIDPATGMPMAPKSEVVPIVTTVGVMGTYDAVKNFLNQVYRLDKFNDISSVSVSKAEVVGEEGQAVSDAGILSLQMTLDFGYLSKLGVADNPNVYSFAEQRFDYSTAEDILKLTKVPDIDIGAHGRTNPFLP